MSTKIKQPVKGWLDYPTAKAEDKGVLVTKPNQSMSIRDILFRNTQGMTYDNYKTPYYEDQATFSSQALNKIQELEPTEKLQYLKEVSTQVETLQNKIKQHEAEKAAAAAAAQTIVEEKTTDEVK